MKIVAISDLHGNTPKKLPKADLLVIAGDIIPSLGHDIIQQEIWVNDIFIPYIENKAENVVFCPGNHDHFFEDLMKNNLEDEFRASLPANVHYLRDNAVTIEGIKIWGSPWSKEFCGWPFMKQEIGLDEVYSLIPDDVNIILSHGPAKGYCDMMEQYNETEHLGSASLTNHIKRIQPMYVFSGHIHSGSHDPIIIVEKLEHPTHIVNVSLLDEEYKMKYKPFEVKI